MTYRNKICLAFAGFTLASCFEAPWFAKVPPTGALKDAEFIPEIVEISEKRVFAGGIEANVKASKTIQQTLNISEIDGLQGSQIQIPPGALAIDTAITVEIGVDLNTTGTLEELGLTDDQQVSNLSPTLIIEAPLAPLIKPLSISIPVDASGFQLAGALAKNLVGVLYKVYDSQTNDPVVGVLSGDELTFDGNSVVFSTKRYGAFQIVQLAKPILVKIPEKKSTTTITSQRAAKLVPIEIAGITPYVIPKNGKVRITGKNFSPGIQLAVNGKALGNPNLVNATTLDFVMPGGLPFGLVPVKIALNSIEKTTKVFSLAQKTDLPLITMDPAGVCAGVKYYDASGVQRVGTRSCEGTQIDTDQWMQVQTYDEDLNGVVDSSSHAVNSSSADYAFGKSGTAITVSSMLVPPFDGDFFELHGNGTVNSIAPRDAGMKIRLIGKGNATFNHNGGTAPYLRLTKREPLYVGENDILELTSLGGGSWAQTSFAQHSFVGALLRVGSPINANTGGGYHNLNFDVVAEDPANGYNSGTGVFTVVTPGQYVIKFRMFATVAVHEPMTDCYAGLYINGAQTLVRSGILSGLECLTAEGSHTANLVAGDVVDLRYHIYSMGSVPVTTIRTGVDINQTFLEIKTVP